MPLTVHYLMWGADELHKLGIKMFYCYYHVLLSFYFTFGVTLSFLLSSLSSLNYRQIPDKLLIFINIYIIM